MLAGCSHARPVARAGPAPSTSASPAPSTSVTTVPPDPAAGVATKLQTVETGIGDPATPASQLPGLGEAQQDLEAALVEDAGLYSRVSALLPEPVRSAVASDVTAGVDLERLTPPRPTLPPWHIVAPAPADELQRDYREAEAAFGVPWAYLAAIHLVETRMGRIRGPSTAGAQGPMQFLPSTWARYGQGDINSDHDSILAAARYLHANGAPADMAGALYHYNHSALYVDAVSRYARRMLADPRAYLGYYHWQVRYRLTGGRVVVLPVGWHNP